MYEFNPLESAWNISVSIYDKNVEIYIIKLLVKINYMRSVYNLLIKS